MGGAARERGEVSGQAARAQGAMSGAARERGGGQWAGGEGAENLSAL